MQDIRDGFLPLECDEIPKHILQKAQDELGETEFIRKKCLNELKEKILSEKNLNCNTSTNFLLEFLRVRKFRIDSALALLKTYYKHRQKYASLYSSYSPKQTFKVMEENIINFLPSRNADSSAIYVARFGQWNPETLTFEDVLRFGLLCNEKALDNPVTQICGITSIVDLKGFSWSHFTHIPLSSIRCFISASQDCFPIRHKAIHVINNNGIFSVLFTIIKPLVHKKMRDRIFFHGDNFSSLQQYIPADVLPTEFGGTQGTFQNEHFYSTMLDSEEEYVQRNKYGYMH
ncbi:alpha-tocopherol transfer protein-like [Caerostris darwini]|uniref:Alpha-tocopherol transfer protein-like n=1 Tax=Caerostris darwini TaxID=1538125 RepID=A0AAV4PS07_9ARAC|nr:alpha-tocopherol transfer protein-like [Caerostris darwini]